jgi:FtsZ-binding cell division protein ZapB
MDNFEKKLYSSNKQIVVLENEITKLKEQNAILIEASREIRKYARHNYSCNSQQYESCDCMYTYAVAKHNEALKKVGVEG